MCWSAMARKDDPVFNVRFVQFVECQPCLWNYTHPGYSKKEEVQRAWQQVANEIKDTGEFHFAVSFCNAKLYPSPFLPLPSPISLSLSNRNFVFIAVAASFSSSFELRAHFACVCACPEVELEDGDKEKEPPPPHLRVIKWEPTSPLNPMHHQDRILTHQSLVTVPCNNMDWTDVAQWLRSNSSNNNNNNNNNNSTTKISTPPPPPPATPALSAGGGGGGGGGGAGAIPLSIAPPDADYFFLVSLHPYLKEMSGKQCRRFRQKVVALIDNVLDNTDT
ncbi:hypothetical protein KR009_011707 [Drosophila setifemur]|nr:hypothetical protein KR009_011707 [Drosophila setifemur]